MSGFRQFADVLNSWTECGPVDATGLGGLPRNAPGAQQGNTNQRSLAQTIESEVIPRLMLQHRVPRGSLGGEHVSPEDVAEGCRLVLEHDIAGSQQFSSVLMSRGGPPEALYLELLAPTARLLGEMWKADMCDFTDVTVGLSRLQLLLHAISPQFENEVTDRFCDRRILLLPVPGEQHTLGIMLIEEFFRREGWDCCSGMPKTQLDIVRRVKSERFDVVGLSVSCVVLLDQLAAVIQSIRAASLNRQVLILVGGQVFLERPEYAAQVGADGTADDGRQALLQLRSLFNRAVSAN